MKVLVVEDEVIVGMDLVMMLEEWGYEVEGPYRSSGEALESITRFRPGLAILDVNLGRGDTSLPMAEELHARGTPFLFLTGYSPSRYADQAAFNTAPHLRKPVNERALRSLLVEISPATDDD